MREDNMSETKNLPVTYWDDVKATVKKSRSRASRNSPTWFWNIQDSAGNVMAAGEEGTMKVAFQEAHLAVGALRTWSTFSRGSLTPTKNGRRSFTFERLTH